jgi:UDP-glucose:(glucosyl)LPS alpha-1,2-glucosyltransferase|tara:strand:+ start:222 stop:1157 length:936 start_codon:yes stop_codon:yes gene_type:complete
MQPRGATELQMEMLEKHVSKDLLDQVQICTSIPGKVPIDSNKLNILWQKNSWDQPNLQKFFKDPSRFDEYDWYVFNSHWNYEKFRYAFDIPTEKSVVIKNGIEQFPIRKIYKRGTPIKLIHHCTPWRGLNVLLRAMQEVENPNVTLDVYSSCKVYGSEFEEMTEKDFVGLYQQAKDLPNVNYIGYKPHEYIKEMMPNYDMFVYPSIFEETSCASALEALASGVHVITNNFGALYETCAEWPVYINYSKNYEQMAQDTGAAINVAASYLHENFMQEHLQEQQNFYKRFYNWEKKGMEWTNFLKGALNERNNK